MSIDLDLNDRDVLAAMELRRRHLSDEQLRRFESYAPEHPIWGTLVGVKRGGSHLFLRYAFGAAG